MSDQLIANGQYKIQVGYGADAVTAEKDGRHLMVLPETGNGGDSWDVTFDGTDSYTLRNVTTGIYLGGKSDPTRMAPILEGVSEPFAWKIERGEMPETFTLSPRKSNGAMRLGRSPLLIYPPPAAWMPPSGDPSQNWRLVSVKSA